MEENENKENGNFILKNNLKISKFTYNFYLALIITLLLLIINMLLQIVQFNNILSGSSINPQLFSISSISNSILAILSILLYATSTIIFLVWFYQVYANIHLIAPDTVLHSKPMAIFSFILPIFNLFKPFLIAKDIITELNRANAHESNENNPPIKKSVIIYWWTFHLICNVTLSLTSWFSIGDTLEQTLRLYNVSLILFSVSILTILFTLRMIRQISYAESLLFEKYSNPMFYNDIENITD